MVAANPLNRLAMLQANVGQPVSFHRRRRGLAICLALLVVGCGEKPVAQHAASKVDVRELARQVAATDRAFNQAFQDRDGAALSTFLSDEVVWLQSRGNARGKQAVIKSWKPLLEGEQAAFSWAADSVEVLDSGTLAYLTGRLYDTNGVVIATYSNVWRLEAPGQWRLVFDKGYPPPPAEAGANDGSAQ
jgi:ketosteroid isomerase-like protein